MTTCFGPFLFNKAILVKQERAETCCHLSDIPHNNNKYFDTYECKGNSLLPFYGSNEYASALNVTLYVHCLSF